ncbi:DUF3224 domain-containing protein [Cryomorpha ignava]|uniref:DUF3224 domain-containing protein n=1 Tax=Cryomorpha ignava TaxID=101383 RepID=A0A7K3WNQ5_9FLAO|nr:DUF3224 domain-containing protein [Cryomorpha ignava]NEN23287.1 DUF3224 domain-containing protein [Cryomorpha ignava]
MKAAGTFEVKMQPENFSVQGENEIQLGRYSLNKKFNGALNAESKGEMISAMTSVKGSAGYVAIEQVSGSLNGMAGNFVLQHFGIMNRGKDRLILEVVPDSGSGELKNISGSMTIEVKDGKHFYELDFEM